MNALWELARQTAAFSVLWALCELLLARSSFGKIIRLTAGVLMLSALFATAGKWIGEELPVFGESLSWQVQQAGDETYRCTMLTALANQTACYCEGVAERAGYRASAEAVVKPDGSLHHVRLVLEGEGLLSAEELCVVLAGQLGTSEQNIWLEET